MISDGEFLLGTIWYFGLNPIFIAIVFGIAASANRAWLAFALMLALAALDLAAIYFAIPANAEQISNMMLYRLAAGSAVVLLTRALWWKD